MFQDRYSNGKPELIHKGKFARTYKGFDNTQSIPVVIKVFRSELNSKHRTTLDLRYMKSFAHPNVLRCVDIDVSDTIDPFGDMQRVISVVSEFVETENFEGYIKQHPEHREEIIKDILDGIMHIHAADECHGTLHPGNVLIRKGSSRGSALVKGFGSEVLFPDYRFADFMAPEQLKAGTYRGSRAADLWSWGCMACWIVTGKRPFFIDGQEENPSMVLEIISKGCPDLPGLTPHVADLVRTCFIEDAFVRWDSFEKKFNGISDVMVDSSVEKEEPQNTGNDITTNDENIATPALENSEIEETDNLTSAPEEQQTVEIFSLNKEYTDPVDFSGDSDFEVKPAEHEDEAIVTPSVIQVDRSGSLAVETVPEEVSVEDEKPKAIWVGARSYNPKRENYIFEDPDKERSNTKKKVVILSLVLGAFLGVALFLGIGSGFGGDDGGENISMNSIPVTFNPDCKKCLGSGYVNHSESCTYCDCSGYAKLTCDQCNNGFQLCKSCQGGGYIFANKDDSNSKQMIACPTCARSANNNSFAYSKGYILCSECGGRQYKLVKCEVCAGAGQIVDREVCAH